MYQVCVHIHYSVRYVYTEYVVCPTYYICTHTTVKHLTWAMRFFGWADLHKYVLVTYGVYTTILILFFGREQTHNFPQPWSWMTRGRPDMSWPPVAVVDNGVHILHSIYVCVRVQLGCDFGAAYNVKYGLHRFVNRLRQCR